MLKDKMAIVTGASRGIGRAIALELAKCGANVAVIYAGNEAAANDTVECARKLGVNANAYRCDVSDFNAVKQTVSAIQKEMGVADILVNNAGITRDKLIFSMKEEDYDAVLDTNLKGAFNFIKHCYPGFIKKKSGRIINIASVAGIMGNPGQANYSASKAGVIGLTKAAAKELAPRGICCNAVAPGYIATDMTSGLPINEEDIKASIPLGCVGQPEDVAKLVAFLCSDGAKYITGEVIRIDGGLAM